MKVKKEYVVLVFLIAALSIYIALKKTDRRQYTLPEMPAVETREISRVEIRRGEGTDVSLVRDGDRWVIRPVDYPAETSQIEGMLDLLGELTVTAVASEAGNDPIYELDPERRIDVEAFDGDRTVRRVFIGKAAPTGRHTFVKLEGDDRIYHARENLRTRFDKDADKLRDKQVMKIDEDINELFLAEGGKHLLIVKNVTSGEAEQGGVSSEQSPPGAANREDVWLTEDGKPVKKQEVEALVRTLANLKCAGYPPDRTREDLGPPAFTVTLKGAGDYEFSLYGKEDGKYLATSSQSGYVFLIPEWQAKKVRLDLEKILESEGGDT